jgi:hypothetical protein
MKIGSIILICTALILTMGDAATALEVKVDMSCPGMGGTKKGGDWSDFEVGGGCDGDRHDPRYWTDPVTNIGFGVGHPGGHGNLVARGGDPICNTGYRNYYNEPGPMMLQIHGGGHVAGSYTIEVLHAWDGGNVANLSVSGADSHTIHQVGELVNTGSDADLIAATDKHTLVDYTISNDGQQVKLQWDNSFAPMNAWILTPEPATIALLGLGGLALIRRKR